MKSWTRRVLGAVFLAAASARAFAQDPALEHRHYLGASAGESRFEEACAFAGRTSCEDRDMGYKLFYGFAFNRYAAFELGYASLGQVTQRSSFDTRTTEATAFELSALGSWPVKDRLAVYGRLGVYVAELASNETGFDAAGPSESWGGGITFGLGARFDVTDRFALRTEWQRYDDIGGTVLDVLSLGGLYRF